MKDEVTKYPGLSYEQFFADDAARRLLRYPGSFDVIVTSNMFGDILADEASELVGGLGMVGSACVGGKVAYFEPVHGSAPKYANKNVINPTATILLPGSCWNTLVCMRRQMPSILRWKLYTRKRNIGHMIRAAIHLQVILPKPS